MPGSHYPDHSFNSKRLPINNYNPDVMVISRYKILEIDIALSRPFILEYSGGLINRTTPLATLFNEPLPILHLRSRSFRLLKASYWLKPELKALLMSFFA
jgi:hypothetical protein